MPLEIIQIGHPMLRSVAQAVALEQIKTDAVQDLIDALIATMRLANGAGLAATQVAVPWRIFVVEVKDNPRYPYKPDIPLTVLINPEIEFLTTRRFKSYEGCLSVPDLRGVVERCPAIRIKAYNRQGEALTMCAKGITAGTFQHEYDHLNGGLFVDRVSDTKTLCTWQEFRRHYENDYKKMVQAVVAEYGA